MDGGFKKLWKRQRPKGKSGLPATDVAYRDSPTYEVHISGPPPQIGTLPSRPSRQQSARPTTAKTAQAPQDGIGVLRARESQSLDQARRNRGGIHPVLVGISRPQTASSLSRAVSQAADAVAEDLPGIATTPAPQQSRNQKQKTARHVDIFSANIPKLRSGNSYSEDVAERNLDYQRYALDTSYNGYNPNSRFQEEVAMRNASLELLRGSQEKPRSSRDYDRDSATASQEGASNPIPSSYIHSSGKVRQVNGQVHEPASVQQPRLYSMNGREPPVLLPTIPQEDLLQARRGDRPRPNRAGEEYGVPESFQDALDRQAGKARPPVTGLLLEVPPPTSNVMKPASKSNNRANVSRPLLSSAPKGLSSASIATKNSMSSMPDYQISPAEQPWTPPAAGQNRSRPGYFPQLPSYRSDRSMGNVSMLSGFSQKSALRKAVYLHDRTIMDLTGDDSDVFDDNGGISPYLEPPVVQQAKYSELYRPDPSLVARLYRSARPVDAKDDETSQDSKATTRAREMQISFSKISTVASFSPRSSISEPYLRGLKTDDQGTNTRTMETGSAEMPVSATESSPKSLSRPSAPISISVSPPSDKGHGLAEPPTVPTYTPNRKKAGTSRYTRNAKLPPVVEDASQTTPTSRLSRVASGSKSPEVYASPESLTSTDYRNPTKAFGVLARDFAAREGAKESEQDDDPTPRNSFIWPLPSNGTPKINSFDATSPPPYVDGGSDGPRFNEDEFAKKQARAREALLRLQRSLSEGVETLSSLKSHAGNEDSAPAPVVQRRAQPPISRFRRSQSDRPAAFNVVPKWEVGKARESRSVDETSAPYKPPSPPPSSPRPTFSFHSMVTSPVISRVNSPTVSRHNTTDSISSIDGLTKSTQRPVMQAEPSLVPVQAGFDASEDQAISPGEISLSSFPLPNPTPQHSRQASLSRPGTARRNSLRSITSNSTVYSIPEEMIPSRSSSIQDYADAISVAP